MKKDEFISSKSYYMNRESGSVIKVEKVSDDSRGMCPLYYRVSNKEEGKLLVSSSVVSLIEHSGEFVENKNFSPPEWFATARKRRAWFLDAPLRWLTNGLEYSTPDPCWYASWQTADSRIFKLRPHETVFSGGRSKTNFKRKENIKSHEVLIDEVAKSISKAVNRIEEEFPSAKHVVLTGGKDSMIINLIEKKDHSKWNIFSGVPNYYIVKEWVEKNNLEIDRLIKGRGENNESTEMIRNKVVGSDLFSDPKHMRWLPQLKEISNANSKVIFWAGTVGDTFLAYNDTYHSGTKNEFWRKQTHRAASWQGNVLQTIFNVTNSPVVPIYHTKEMINVQKRYDPSIIEADCDLRKEIGKRLSGDISWPEKNPGPPEYQYEEGIKSHAIYYEEVLKSVQK